MKAPAWLKIVHKGVLATALIGFVVVEMLHIFAGLFHAEVLVEIGLILLALSAASLLLFSIETQGEGDGRHTELVELLDGVAKRGALPFMSHSDQELHDLGSEIARNATKRVVLLSRCSILLVGPRPYDSATLIRHESEQHAILMDVVRRASRGQLEFQAGYLVGKTRRRISEHATTLPGIVRRNLAFLDDAMNQRESRFVLKTPPVDWESPFTFIVGDDRFAIWFRDPTGHEPAICISATDSKIATALLHIFEQHCKRRTLAQLQEQLPELEATSIVVTPFADTHA